MSDVDMDSEMAPGQSSIVVPIMTHAGEKQNSLARDDREEQPGRTRAKRGKGRRRGGRAERKALDPLSGKAVHNQRKTTDKITKAQHRQAHRERFFAQRREQRKLDAMITGLGDLGLEKKEGTETAEAAKAVEGVDSGIRRRGGPRKAKAEAKKDIRDEVNAQQEEAQAYEEFCKRDEQVQLAESQSYIEFRKKEEQEKPAKGKAYKALRKKQEQERILNLHKAKAARKGITLEQFYQQGKEKAERRKERRQQKRQQERNAMIDGQEQEPVLPVGPASTPSTSDAMLGSMGQVDFGADMEL